MNSGIKQGKWILSKNCIRLYDLFVHTLRYAYIHIYIIHIRTIYVDIGNIYRHIVIVTVLKVDFPTQCVAAFPALFFIVFLSLYFPSPAGRYT